MEKLVEQQARLTRMNETRLTQTDDEASTLLREVEALKQEN